MKCNHPHFCPSWDYIFITPLLPEFECCICECNMEQWAIEDYENCYGLAEDELTLLNNYLKSIGLK